MAIDLLGALCGDALHHDSQVKQRGHVDRGRLQRRGGSAEGRKRTILNWDGPSEWHTEARVVGQLDDPLLPGAADHSQHLPCQSMVRV